MWAYGLRNPWRYSFDRLTGELWLGDVGQGNWEEVEEIIAGGNYGWDCYEGNAAFELTPDCPAASELQFPRATYSISGVPCAVTGGYVYRGVSLHEIYGWYVYGDYCSGQIWALNPADNSAPVLLVDTAFSITSFAELPNGELLVLTFNNAIYRLTCAALPDSDSDGLGNACDQDDDNDGFSDVAEALIGTNPTLKCGDNAWPPDFNNDTFITAFDLNVVAGDIGKLVPPGPVREDIGPDPPDGAITAFDLSAVAGLIGESCAI